MDPMGYGPFFWKMSSTPEAGLIILGLKMWGITIRSAQIEPVFVHERQIDPIHSHPLIMRNWCSNSEALEGGSKFLPRHGCILRFTNLWQSQGFFLQRYPFFGPKKPAPFSWIEGAAAADSCRPWASSAASPSATPVSRPRHRPGRNGAYEVVQVGGHAVANCWFITPRNVELMVYHGIPI